MNTDIRCQISGTRQKKIWSAVYSLWFMVCFWCLGFGASALAQQDNKAYDIMLSAYNRYDGYTRYFKVEMILEDKHGSKRKRQLITYSKDYGELIKTYLKFTEPADIRGTRFLSWENKDADDTQYLYLPALGKARRIVSSQKNVRFVNTDYTYEDMQRRHPDEDEHRFLGHDYYDGYHCFIIESTPKEGNSQYGKRIFWIDKEHFVILRIKFFDKKGAECKEFYVAKLEDINGVWTQLETTMRDLNESHTTYMNVLEAKYNMEIDDALFSLQSLSKD